MDAPEDAELHLQRASVDLLREFSSSLPRFLWLSPKVGQQSDGEQGPSARKIVKERSTEQLIKLLEPFQEWPQLLDPHLSHFISLLNSAFLDYLSNHSGQYLHSQRRPSTGFIPLPRGICKLLYTLCKIRGEKIICRFLSNEPKWLDPMLDSFQAWNQIGPPIPEDSTNSHGSMIWEERYIALLWLSHLMLTPFDLVSISSTGPEDFVVKFIELPPETPAVAKRLIQICTRHMSLASREREAATRLLVRLTLRPDMRDICLLDSLLQWALLALLPQPVKSLLKPVYYYIGILSFLSGVIASADNSIIAPFLVEISEKIQAITTEETPVSHEIFSSALARKLIIKILRSITLQALLADSSTSPSNPFSLLDSMLEDVIDQLLIFLGDKDTPVRFAASKALSVIAAKLDPSLAARITEAVIDGLEEDTFWEDVMGKSKVYREENIGPSTLKRNLTAVNPLRWQGLVLTLSHLIYRRSPPVEQLAEILKALMIALRFEQRSSIGTSIGTSVRDAACFGMWALARRYTTKELLSVDASCIHPTKILGSGDSVLQIISNEVLLAATLDPSGNIRRGASAALQEMIGRHPDTIKEGIQLVQTVDYHAVALRSKALIEVAVGASRLNESYRFLIVDGLLDWRGIRSADSQSRRFAATAIGLLCTTHSATDMESVLGQVQAMLKSLHPRQVEERHGLLLTLAAMVNESREIRRDEHGRDSADLQSFRRLWDIFRSFCPLADNELTSTALRPHLTSEAACALISALSLATSENIPIAENVHRPSAASLKSCLNILNLSLLRPEDVSIKVSSKAASDVFLVLDLERKREIVENWINTLKRDQEMGKLRDSNMCMGRIAAIGLVFWHFSPSKESEISRVDIINALLRQTEPSNEIEARVAAINSLSCGPLTCNTMTIELAKCLESSLMDYSIDRRGDIGSLARLEAISAAGVGLSRDLFSPELRRSLLGRLCCLAVEKLDKVRFRAWTCLQGNWKFLEAGRPVIYSILDVNSTTTTLYFEQMLSLYLNPVYRSSLLEGYVSASGAGSDALLQASRSALVSFVEIFSIAQLIEFCTYLNNIIRTNIERSIDRVVIPTLVVYGFLFDTGVFERVQGQDDCWSELFALTQRSHYKSTNMHKLEAAVKLYTGLAQMPSVQRKVISKLCSMLLHPYPIIRNAAADGLFMLTELVDLRRLDWSDSPKKLKSDVQHIRDRLKADRNRLEVDA